MNKLIFKTIVCILMLTFAFIDTANSANREYLWPKGKMPEAEVQSTRPYLDWLKGPSKDKRNGACMILISDNGCTGLDDDAYIQKWHEQLTDEGVQCVKLSYRTSYKGYIRSYQMAWQDGQRAVRIVRSEAKKRGYDPEKIGIISMSAGSHLGLLLATSSSAKAYKAVDMFVSMGSVKCWGKMRAIGVQSELHTLALRKHCFQEKASPGTGSYSYLDRIYEFLSKKGFNK